jgi:hypothetical protein
MSEEEKIEDQNEGQQSSEENNPVEPLQIEQSEMPLISGTENNKPQTEEMEVHHHPKVEKKNFKEYFLEIVMIFLAVTLGFFAENIREHFTDKSKEREFIVSLKEDLVSDTIQLNFLLPFSDTVYEKLDSLYFLLQAAGKGEPYDIHKLYYMNFTYGFGLLMFVPNNRTISQIKNTGGFSLIKNQACRDSITVYDNFNESAIKFNSTAYQDWMNDLNKMSQKIFYYDQVKTFASSFNQYDFFLNDSLQLKLINNDKLLLIEYANKVRSLMMMFNILIVTEKIQFESSKALVALLNKEYDLK